MAQQEFNQDSYSELLRSFEYIPRNFRLTRNIPIDTRFLVENINQLGDVIPESIRYPGMIFFVRDTKVNDGTTKNIDGTKNIGSTEYGTNKITGILYYFDDELKPIPLHDLVERFEIRLLNINLDKYDYSKLIDTTDNSNEENSLNHLYSKIGNIVFIEPLGIAVICRYIDNKPEWRYLAGSYNVSSEELFYSIPESLREINTVVNINGIKKIITSNYELSDEIIKADLTKDCTEDRRFYNINGFIYYCFGGITIPVSNKFILKTTDLKIGNNYIDLPFIDEDDITTIWNTNFNTRNIIVDCIVGDQDDDYLNTLYQDYRLPCQHKIVNDNKINIISSIAVKKVTLIIRTNE